MDNKQPKRRSKATDLSNTLIYGKVPPNAPEIEQVILGAIMLEKGRYEQAAEILEPEHFYKLNHQIVFKAFGALKQKSTPIDIMTVTEHLQGTGEIDSVGGPYGVTILTNSVVSGAHISSHARIVYDKFVAREIIRIAGEAITNAYSAEYDPYDLLNETEGRLSALSIAKTAKPYKKMGVIAKEGLDEIHRIRNNKDTLTGVPCGIREIDDVTQGWQPTNLIILAARPGVGKSAAAGNFAYNAATHPIKPTPVGIFSLEMSGIQWVMRIMAAESQILLKELKRAQITDNDLRLLEDLVLNKLNEVNIFFDDTPSMDIYTLKSKARMMVLNEGVGLLIIDYLQLMSGKKQPGENREQEVSRISRELKQLAKELNIPIIALCQLSRQGDSDSPRLSHLRESGAIEQDADDVIFLVDITEEDVATDASLRDSILVKVSKHRNGERPDLNIRFVKGIQKLMSEEQYNRYSNPVPHRSSGYWQPIPNADRFIEPSKNED